MIISEKMLTASLSEIKSNAVSFERFTDSIEYKFSDGSFIAVCQFYRTAYQRNGWHIKSTE